MSRIELCLAVATVVGSIACSRDEVELADAIDFDDKCEVDCYETHQACLTTCFEEICETECETDLEDCLQYCD